MSLRAINPYTSYQMLMDLQRTKDQLANLQEQLASGNRLSRLSDDPTASALVLDFQTSIDQNKTYINQANSANSFLQTTETTLQSVSDAVARLLEIGQQGLSETNSSSSRNSIAQEVDGIKANLLGLANTQAQGKYIFAGTLTTTPPFTATAGGANYVGDSGLISLAVSASTTVTTNIPGNTAFFGNPPTGGQNSATDLFRQVSDLSSALKNNDTAGIRLAYTNLKSSVLENVTNSITDLGARQAQLQDLTDNLSSYNLSLQTIQGSYQDLDYPTAITDYTQTQTAQQASLSVLAKMNNLNLFNYLG
ncbi:flagellar hook-associated protein FlgL [uncultured Tolumonas sp.]|uniref:flagellar hook-associated protein FlgL n=1 Tax=uncultured Tolumonas sp. TaxID=263765 RepID=UPI00293193F9|nr:flagellar hook-associated protein FlgL [uncultured Tolumonas sp.]